jgi:hypothetical protein
VKNCWPAKPRLRRPSQRVRRDLSCGAGTRAPRSRRVNSGRRHRWRCRTVRTWTHTGSLGTDPGAHAVEFSKTAAPSREGDSFADGAPERETRGAGLVSIAPISRPERPQSGADPTGRGRIARWARNGSAAAPTAGMPERTASGRRGAGREWLGRNGGGPGASGARRPGGGEAQTAASAYDSTDTATTRSRGRSSKSIKTTCCHVPSPSSPRTTGTDSDGPITAARRCACALVSWLRTLC